MPRKPNPTIKTKPQKYYSNPILISSIILVLILSGLSFSALLIHNYQRQTTKFISPPISQSTLGDVQITVYAKGKKMTLDPNSPHFKQLQIACEQLILSSFVDYTSSTTFDNWATPTQLKNNEWTIELSYQQPISQRNLGFAKDISKLVSIHQFLIPLTGQLTELESYRGIYTAILPFEKVTFPTDYPETTKPRTSPKYSIWQYEGEPIAELQHDGPMYAGPINEQAQANSRNYTESIDWTRTNSSIVGTTQSVNKVKKTLVQFNIIVP